jgi:hypothetical protein
MRRRVWPYLRPAPSTVDAGGWHLIDNDVSQDLPSALPYWDYRMDLALRRTVDIDLEAILSATMLSADARLSLAVIWASSGSSLREPAVRVPLPSGGRYRGDLDLLLPGERLGGTLVLRTVLTLVDPGTARKPLAPARPGSMLWSDECRVRLQGDAPQFPIAVIDFTQTPLPDAAAWHLDVSSQLEAATMGAVLLYVNERSKAVVRAFQNAAAPRPADRLILSAVYADVARTMVDAALNNDDLVDDAAFDDDTLGQTLQNLLRRLFPGRSTADLRHLRDHSPHLLTTQIQAAVGIFREP